MLFRSNHVKEKDFKLKNWYGNTIDFVNRYNNVSILDIGCGLGFFLSAIKKNIERHGLEESKFAIDYIKKKLY